MLTVTHPRTTVTLPTEWDEVSLGTFNNLLAITDPTPRRLLECLCSDINALHQIDAGSEPQLIGAMPFLLKQPDFAAMPVPSAVLGVTPPQAINLCPIIQVWSFEQWVKDTLPDEEPGYISAAPGLLAVYLYPGLTGKTLTGSEQIAEVMDRVMSIPVTEALPLTAFFLTSLRQLVPSGRMSLRIHPARQRPNAWQMSLLANLAIMRNTLRLVRLPKKGGSPTSRLNNWSGTMP